MDCIRHRLHEEYQKSLSRGQLSAISSTQEEGAFNTMDFKYGRNWVHPMQEGAKSSSLTYLSLFRKQIVPTETSPLIDEQASLTNQ
jgi:hypothetical protein